VICLFEEHTNEKLSTSDSKKTMGDQRQFIIEKNRLKSLYCEGYSDNIILFLLC
jgi:hypothetical protein